MIWVLGLRPISHAGNTTEAYVLFAEPGGMNTIALPPGLSDTRWHELSGTPAVLLGQPCRIAGEDDLGLGLTAHQPRREHHGGVRALCRAGRHDYHRPSSWRLRHALERFQQQLVMRRKTGLDLVELRLVVVLAGVGSWW